MTTTTAQAIRYNEVPSGKQTMDAADYPTACHDSACHSVASVIGSGWIGDRESGRWVLIRSCSTHYSTAPWKRPRTTAAPKGCCVGCDTATSRQAALRDGWQYVCVKCARQSERAIARQLGGMASLALFTGTGTPTAVGLRAALDAMRAA